MATIDNSLKLADSQVVVGTGASTNALDFGTLQKDLGVGEALSVVLSQVVAPVATGTYTVALRTSATVDGAGALNGTINTLLTRTISANQKAGAQMDIPLPNELSDGDLLGLLQYIDIYFTLGGSNPSLTVNADLRPRKFVDNYNANLASGFKIG